MRDESPLQINLLLVHKLKSSNPIGELVIERALKESKLSDNEITVVHSSCIYLKKVNYLQVSNKYIVNIK